MDYEAAITYQESNRAVIRALALIAFVVGLAIILGGPERFNHTPSLSVAAQFPGGWVSWGVAAMGIGAWTTVASIGWHRRGVMFGMLAQTLFFSFWTVTIGVSAFQQPTAPLTGIGVYGGYSLTCAIKFVAGRELARADRG